MPELRAESQSFTLRPGVGLAAAGHVLAVGSSLPAARSPPASALPQLPGRERGGSARRRAGAARSRLWHDQGLAPGTGSVIPCMNVRARVGSGGCRGGVRHRGGGRAGRVPAGARGEHVGLRWRWGDAVGLLIALLNFAGDMSWCLTGC